MPVLAAVDIGSNSVRLKIAKLSRSRLETLHEDREVTRLGEGAFLDGALSPRAIAATVKVLQRFRRAATSSGSPRSACVATSATRDARNGREFAAWVKRATGWTLEVISGLEEGRLIHLGVTANSRISARRVLFFDLGGGSCEITVAEEGHIHFGPQSALGRGAAPPGVPPPRSADPAGTPAHERFHPRRVGARRRLRAGEERSDATIATSGTAAAINAATRALENRGKHSNTVARTAVFDLLDTLTMLDERSAPSLPGINASRARDHHSPAPWSSPNCCAPTACPAFVILRWDCATASSRRLAADLDQQSRAFKRVEEERQDALAAMCRRYAVDLRHANHVRELARQLFLVLRRLHGLRRAS